MNKSYLFLSSFVAVALLSGAVHAAQGENASGPQGNGGGAGDGQQGAERFQNFKTRLVENHQKRITIVQQGIECIQAATAPQQLKNCLQEERQADQQLRSQMGQGRRAPPQGRNEQEGGDEGGSQSDK